MTELHYRRPFTCDYAAAKNLAEQLLGNELDASDTQTADKAFLIFHKQHSVEYAEGEPFHIQLFSEPQSLLLWRRTGWISNNRGAALKQKLFCAVARRRGSSQK